MGNTGNQKGSTMIELIMVMVLLLLFGITVYTLTFAGASAEERIMGKKNAQTDVRIALSYINVRLRQNDVRDKIAVETAELTGKNAIVIKDRADDYAFDTWIFCYDGKLMECITDPGAQPKAIDSFTIADLYELDTELDPDSGSVTNTVTYSYGDSTKQISSTVYLRSYSESGS